MRILVVEDELKMAGLLNRGSRRGRKCRRRRPHGRRCGLDGAGGRLRRDRPRPDAARHRRRRGLPALARERRLGARAHAHRARCGRRSRRRAGRGRRRLPARSRSRSPSSRRGCARSCVAGARERPVVLEVGDLRLDPATHQVWRGPTEIELSAKEFALLETFMRRPGDVAVASPAPRARLGLRLREPLERRRRLRPLPPREDRSPVRARRRSRPCAASGYRLRKDGKRVSRLPIRIRLTLVFALVMAVVLAALGAFLYVRLGASLDERIADNAREPERRSRAQSCGRAEWRVSIRRSSRRGRRRAGDRARRLESSSRRRQASRCCSRRASSRRARRGSHDDPTEGGFRLRADPVDERVSSWSASCSRIATRRSTRCLTQLLVALPLALLVVVGHRLPRRRRGAAARRGDAASSSRASPPDEPERRLPLPAARDEIHRLGETLNEMLDRLDAGARARAALRRGREPRAPHAARAAQDGARARDATARARRTSSSGAALGRDETDRLVRLAEDLLVLARADDGELALQSSAYARRSCSTPCSRPVRGASAGRGREIWSTRRPDLVARGDRHRLAQALDELVDNALRHGGGSGRAPTRGREDGVGRAPRRRRGRGFPPEFVPHAFERFSRATPRAATEAPASGSRSWMRSRGLTAARRMPTNLDGGGADVWMCSRVA